MFDAAIRYSPLSAYGDGQSPVADFGLAKVQEISNLSYFILRAQPDDASAMAAFSSGFAFELPQSPGKIRESDSLTCCWQSYDQWLIIADDSMHQEIEQKLSLICAEGFTTWTDQSSALTTVRVSGERAIELLSNGIAYDLNPANFDPGEVVQTVIAKTGIMVINRSKAEFQFDLVVRRSFADYLWLWLLDVGAEMNFRSDSS